MVWTVLLFCLVSCASTSKKRQQQAKAYRELGVAYMEKGDFTSALRELLEAEKTNPDDPYIHDYLGLTYVAKKQYDLAIPHFNKALKLKPDYTQARNNLGNTYLLKQEWDTAIALFEKASQDLLYQTTHFPLSNIGWAYYNKKEYRLAEIYYLKALALQPKFITALNGLGKTYMAMGNLSKAVETFEKAITISPDTVELYFNLGRTYAQMGNLGKAREAYSKVIALQPDSSLAKEAKKESDKLKQQLIW